MVFESIPFEIHERVNYDEFHGVLTLRAEKMALVMGLEYLVAEC